MVILGVRGRAKNNSRLAVARHDPFALQV